MCGGLAGVALLATVAVWPSAARQPPANPLEQAFQAYITGDYEAIDRLVPAQWFAGDARDLRNHVDAAMSRWMRERRPAHAAFLLEVARYGLSLQSPDAMWILEHARHRLVARPDPPGSHPEADAFELAWHKAAVALLGGVRLPDVLEQGGVEPARARISASAPAGGEPRLVDPWIALAHAMVAEQRALADPRTFARHAREAIRRFEEAAKYEPNRIEAAIRMAGLLARLGRHADALTELEKLGDASGSADPTLRYWGLLFRGRALEGLERFDEASAALREALEIFPGAQTPAAALAALEARRGDPEAARRWALAPRPVTAGADPWLQYGSGDYRLLSQRLDELRRLSR